MNMTGFGCVAVVLLLGSLSQVAHLLRNSIEKLQDALVPEKEPHVYYYGKFSLSDGIDERTWIDTCPGGMSDRNSKRCEACLAGNWDEHLDDFLKDKEFEDEKIWALREKCQLKEETNSLTLAEELAIAGFEEKAGTIQRIAQAIEEDAPNTKTLAEELAVEGFEEMGGEIQRIGTKELKEAVKLTMTLEHQMSNMLFRAEAFTVATKLLRSGKVAEALVGNSQSQEVTLGVQLGFDMFEISHITGRNVQQLEGWKSALKMPNVPPQHVKTFEGDVQAAMDLQSAIKKSALGLFPNTQKALTTFDQADIALNPIEGEGNIANFNAMEGEVADNIAHTILQQLGLLKVELKSSRIKLKTLIAEINAV